MRLVVSLAIAATLAACSGGNDSVTDLGPVCAEQSALAQNGTTAGGQITITCPN